MVRSRQRITTLDAHTAGEPLRLITSGYPAPVGATMLAKRRWLQAHADPLRRLLMHEPRGHADMYGCLLTEPTSADSDLGALFLHNEGYSTMCGHAIIALVTLGLEHELFVPRDPSNIRIDTPAGQIRATALSAEPGRIHRVSFENVPSFVLHSDATIDLSASPVGPQERTSLRCDIAFGGAFYAYVDAADIGLTVVPSNTQAFRDAAASIKQAVQEQYAICHPGGDSDLGFLYGVVFVEPLVAEGSSQPSSRNVCVFADGEVDRSPTGTGVSGRAAIHHHRGELALGGKLVVESIVGTQFTVRVLRKAELPDAAGVFERPIPAIVPEVSGSASLTGEHTFYLEPDDPLPGGFLLR